MPEIDNEEFNNIYSQTMACGCKKNKNKDLKNGRGYKNQSRCIGLDCLGNEVKESLDIYQKKGVVVDANNKKGIVQ